MHVIEVNGTDYKCIQVWPEMKLSKAIEIQQIIDDMPSLLRKIYDLNTKDSEQKDVDELLDKIEPDDRIKHFPLFYGEIIKAFTNIPGEVMNQVMWDVRTEFYVRYCEKLVIGLIYGDYSDIKGIESFKFKRSADSPLINQTYHLPKSDHALANPTTKQSREVKPMVETQTIEFTEVADLEVMSERAKGGKYALTPNIISILCRPKGEVYNEKTSLDRADIFMDLTMDIVWEVFFCIHRLSVISSQNIQIYKLEKENEMQRKRNRRAWNRSGGMGGSWKWLRKGYFSGESKARMQ